MKVALFSNFLNHHQLPLCLSFVAKEQVQFKFVACEKIPDDRLKMGYADMNKAYPFALCAYENEAEAIHIAETYDVVIFGAAPLTYLAARMNHNLLTFRFAERALKKGTWRILIPITWKKIKAGYTAYKDQNLYVLGASAYTASDLVLCGFQRDKCFTWGYFPEVQEKNLTELFEHKAQNTVPEILYAGRLLPLKHVMDTVKAVHCLLRQKIDVHLTIIGDGETKVQIANYITHNMLDQSITLLPFMPPEKVRIYMDGADIFVFGSNFYEGWGAVVNEAMNSACAVVVSHAVGSAAFLIRHKENGYIYEFANIRRLTSYLAELAVNPYLRKKIGEKAYETVRTMWATETAVQRFLTLSDALLEGKEYHILYKNGPCSLSPIYRNNWIKRNLRNKT